MTRISVRANTGISLSLYVFDCASCGVVFGVDSTYDARRREDEKTFYCPNGHHMSYTESETDRLRKRADHLRTMLCAEQDQAEAARREASEAKASEIRLRWRVGNGVCPCCQRTFPGLAAHVSSKHPEFLTQDLDRLSERQVQLLASLRRITEAEDVAVVDVSDAGMDWRTVRALERRSLVEIIGWGQIALTEQGWPLAERAATIA